MRSIRFILWCLLATGTRALLAQTPAPVPAATPTITIKTLDVVNRQNTLELDARFDSILDLTHPEDLTDSNVTITATPSNSHMVPARIHASSDSAAEITLGALPDGKDTSIQVCFTTLHFQKITDNPLKTYTSPAGTPVCSTSKIMTKADASALVSQLNAAAAKAKADKASSEKNIFASGFVTTASQSTTQGGADISLNDFLGGLPGANTFLQIQKTSLANGDPRHFEAGLSWRHTTSFDASRDSTIVDEVNKFEKGGTEADQEALVRDINRQAAGYGVLLGAIEDFAMKLEGDPTQFKAANAVGDGDIRILTRTLKLFGSTNGYFRARPLVMGFEGGRSIGQGEPTTTTTGTTTSTTTPNVDWLARGKAGADFTLYYENKESNGPIKRVEINAGGIERYLFFKEINYDPKTKMDSTTGKGSRPYFQTDVKVFFVENDKGRYGLRMAYTRGSLPPVFADTKSFQFGFVFETVDDKVK
jgi:hypothetical protein